MFLYGVHSLNSDRQSPVFFRQLRNIICAIMLSLYYCKKCSFSTKNPKGLERHQLEVHRFSNPELEKLSNPELENLSTSELEKLSIPDLEKILEKLSTSELEKMSTPESEMLSRSDRQEVPTPELEKLSTPECHKKPTPVSEAFIEEVDEKIKLNSKPKTPVVIARKRKRPENDLEDSSLNLVSLFI